MDNSNLFIVQKRKKENLSIFFGFFSFFSFFLYSYKYFEINGYILYSSILFFLFFLFEKGLVKKNLKSLNKIDLLVLIYFSYCFIWVSINFLFYKGVDDFYIYSIQSLIFMLIMYLLGRNLSINEKFKKFFCLLFFLNIIFFIINFNWSLSTLSFINEQSGEISVTYQAIARCYLVVGCFLTVLLKINLNKVLIGFLTLFLLFLIGSRSDFIAFLLFITSYIVFFFSLKYKISVIFFLFSCIIFMQLEAVDLTQYRVFSLIDGFSGSSWGSRKDFESYTIDIIGSSPLFGGLYEQYLNFGVIGSYSHNILSAWQSYGLFGFFILILLIFFPVLSVVYKFFLSKASMNEYSKFIVCFGLSSIILLLISKPHYWSIFFLYIGVFAKGLLNEDNSSNISSSKK